MAMIPVVPHYKIFLIPQGKGRHGKPPVIVLRRQVLFLKLFLIPVDNIVFHLDNVPRQTHQALDKIFLSPRILTDHHITARRLSKNVLRLCNQHNFPVSQCIVHAVAIYADRLK